MMANCVEKCCSSEVLWPPGCCVRSVQCRRSERSASQLTGLEVVLFIPLFYSNLSSTEENAIPFASSEEVVMPYLIALTDFRKRMRNIGREHKVLDILKTYGSFRVSVCLFRIIALLELPYSFSRCRNAIACGTRFCPSWEFDWKAI